MHLPFIHHFDIAFAVSLHENSFMVLCARVTIYAFVLYHCDVLVQASSFLLTLN